MDDLGEGGSTVASSWIPGPIATAWTALFALGMVVHLGHAAMLSGHHRRWHGGHVLMAVGMVVMFLPGRGMLIPVALAVWVFGLAAGLLALGLVVARLRRLRLGPLWVASVVDLAAMAYMFAMMSSRLAWLSALAATWFTVQALGWATGWLGKALEHGGLGDTSPPSHHAGAPLTGPDREPAPPSAAEEQQQAEAEVSGGAVTVAVATVTARAAAIQRRVIDGGRHDWSVRLTLTVMAGGMAYMLLAMQFGTGPVTGEMSGMGGM